MWLYNLTLVLSDRVVERGAIAIEDGAIAAISDNSDWLPPRGRDRTTRDMRGLTAIPGIIDMHGDMIEREIEPRPRAYLPYPLALYELDKRLAASGVTTAYAAVSFSEISVVRNSLRKDETGRAIVRAIHDARPHLQTDLRAHARFEVTNGDAAATLRALLEERVVDMVSLNDHTPGQGQYRDLEKYVKEMSAWRGISNDYAEEITRERLHELSQRPVAWDVIRDVAKLAVGQGVPLASHDDDTLEKVSLMREFGVSISEFPVTIEAAREARRVGMRVAMGAPNALRGVSTGGNLSARDAVAEGVVDMLAADYHPGSLIQAAWLLFKAGFLPLYEAINLISTNVATGAGLLDRGALTVGKRADIAIVDFTGAVPRVRATIRSGRVTFADASSGLTVAAGDDRRAAAMVLSGDASQVA
jgi:alpha-D-ribose 1-methylphosphonate 5-triphosphate diphosphatase